MNQTNDAGRQEADERSRGNIMIAPRREDDVHVAGLSAPVEIHRDPEGIPHVGAGSSPDAFFGQGWVHAQDRLFQMEYDRRRAYGRWAEWVGPAGVEGDRLFRRFRLEDSVRLDWEHASSEARAMLSAFAAGVNAFIASTTGWGIEFEIASAPPEPWQPWDSMAVFKVRHLDMGSWKAKLWRARLLRHLGPERAADLTRQAQPHPLLIVPPAAEYRGVRLDGLEEMERHASTMALVPGAPQGSNNWALAGNRTASGKPLVAGDPHRTLDVPNVYYQNHLACPDWDAIGLSFPGVPGLSHFGHNQRVAWCVTHTHADYQDLFIERFDSADPSRYECRGEWRQADVRRESVQVRGGAPVEIETVATHHGPVVVGEPRHGHAVACAYTAIAGPNSTFDAFVPMLAARSAGELEEAMRPWVEPVNNFVFADVDGRIGYRVRGRVPVRSMANAWMPVPGWTGEHEWRGAIAFEEMPVVRDPDTGFIATANSRVAGAEYPHYIGLDYGPDFRTRRLVARLDPLEKATAADMAAIHADRVCLPARALLLLLARLRVAEAPGPHQDDPRWHAALAHLLAWDHVVDKDAVAPAIYAALRERLMRDLMTPILGPLAAEAFAAVQGGGVTHMSRLKARLAEMIGADDRSLLPPGADWPALLARALAGAVADLDKALGADMAAWQWGRLHVTCPRHPLVAGFPHLAATLDPPSVAVGGDGETVNAASYVPGAGYQVALTSVARYVFDLGDWEASAWVVPCGASGHANNPHWADQLPAWSECRLLPMRYDWARIRAAAESSERLVPG
jgi:penicillin amidase